MASLAEEDYGFISPVKHQMRISGSFAEYRTNHYHAGIDIKSSKGQIGDPLFAVQSGYVSRVKIQSGGYGNVLYISHPNGFTSVYAHMDDFLPEIEAYVRSVQYDVECFEIESYLPKDMFVVKRGQQIGHMGTTGRSTGPHLHFELRDTATDEPVNPYLYGISPRDESAPVAQQFAIYDLSKKLPELIGVYPFNNSMSENRSIQLELESPLVGIAVQMYDRMEGAYNKNEVYKCELSDQADKVFSWEADRFSFEESRQLHSRHDYGLRKKTRQTFQLLFSQSCTNLSFLDDSNWNGQIDLSSGEELNLELNLQDVAKNQFTSRFALRMAKGHTHEHNSVSYDLNCDKDTTLYFDGATLKMSANTLFEINNIDFDNQPLNIDGQTVEGFNLGYEHIPVSRFFKLSVKVDGDKNYSLVKYNSKGRLISYGGKSSNGFLTALLNEFGDYAIYEDVVLPTITTIRFSSNPKRYGEWRFLIKDNLEPGGVLDDLKYKAFLDGRWVRLLYDKKNDLLRFVDLELVGPDAREFKIVVTDNAGNKNERVYELNK